MPHEAHCAILVDGKAVFAEQISHKSQEENKERNGIANHLAAAAWAQLVVVDLVEQVEAAKGA